MKVAQAAGQLKAERRLGQKSVYFPGRPAVLSTFTVAGPMEGQGPLGSAFDTIIPDTYYGERCWEKTEARCSKRRSPTASKKRAPPSATSILC